jgi:hypothetical protein
MRRQAFSLKVLLCGAAMLAGCSEAPERAAVGSPPDAPTSVANEPSAVTPVPSPDQARAQLIRLEEAYSQALIAKDRPFLEAYYAPDFRGGNWMGFWTKSTMLKAVLDDRYSVQSMSLSNLEVRTFGTIGMVQGVSTEVTRVNGRNTSGRWSFTDVFEWRDGRWLAVASHTSELKPDAP